MKYFYLIIVVLFSFYGCKTESKKNEPSKKQNPYAEIKQDMENDTAIALYYYGLDKYQEMEYDSAMFYFKESLKLEKSPILYNEMGTTSLTQEKYSEAIKYYTKGVEIDSTYWPNYINQSRVYLILKEFVKAENILNLVIKKCESEYWLAYANYYLAIVNLNEGNDCQKILNYLNKSKILESDPDIREQYLRHKNIILKNCS